MTYRRKWGTSVWHSSPLCSKWPAEMLAEERPTLPDKAPRCEECQALGLVESMTGPLRAAG